MPKLSDGTVVPHHVSLATPGQQGAAAYQLTNSNSSLRVGYVVAVHYPEDDGWQEFKVITYEVAAPVAAGNGAWSWQVYSNVRWGMSLGGSDKDFSRMSLRTPKGWKNGQEITPAIIANSTAVLFECWNGRSQFAYIVGFAEHDDLFSDSKTLGHNYRWDFNGVSTTINKDGEYRVEWTGAILNPETNAYKEPNEELAGAYLLFDKTGSIIADNFKGESIKLDKAAKELQAVSRSMALSTTEGDMNVSTKGKVNVQAQGNAVFNSGAKVYIGSEGSSQPLVRGTDLTDALKDLIDKILTVPLIGQAGPFPCILHPGLRAQLMAWKTIYATSESPFLSRKGYVE